MTALPEREGLSREDLTIHAIDLYVFQRIEKTSAGLRRLAAIAVIATVASAPLFAHDMWIEPTNFSPASGDIIGARLRVGQDMIGDPLPHDDRLINQFIAEVAKGRRPL